MTVDFHLTWMVLFVTVRHPQARFAVDAHTSHFVDKTVNADNVVVDFDVKVDRGNKLEFLAGSVNICERAAVQSWNSWELKCEP